VILSLEKLNWLVLMSVNITKEIAKRLKAARKSSGFKTAKEFSIAQNIPLSTYSQHESGKRSINAELLMNYSIKLQINPYWLLTGNGDAFLGKIDLEKKYILENENFSILNNEEKFKNYSFIDIQLLKKILILAEPLLNDKTVKLSYPKLIDYCFELYEVIVTLTVDLMEKEKIINLSLSSLKRGTAIEKEIIIN
jgi:transcriptional regulator with XRE-family HTH domain